MGTSRDDLCPFFGTGVSAAWASAGCSAGPEPTYPLWDSKSEIGFRAGWNAVSLRCSWPKRLGTGLESSSRAFRCSLGSTWSPRWGQISLYRSAPTYSRSPATPGRTPSRPCSSPSGGGMEDRRVGLREERIAQCPRRSWAAPMPGRPEGSSWRRVRRGLQRPPPVLLQQRGHRRDSRRPRP